MNWNQLPPLSGLRAFVAFVDTGGVQQAGTALNVSHAAISQQLRQLENHLGVTLLDRSGGAMSLTPEGRLLADAGMDGFSGMAAAVAAITGAEDARPVQITTTTSFAANWLMPRLPEYRQKYPKDDIVIEARAERQDPAPGGIDLAIRYGDGTWPGLDAEELMGASVVVVATPDLVAQLPDTSAKSLAKFPWFQELGTHEGSEWLARQGHVPKAGLTTAPGNISVDAARAGQGIAITSRVAVETDLQAGRLICLFEEDADKGYYLLTRPGVQRPPLRRFVRWLRRAAKTQQS